jgi:hypothetical protein
VLGLVLAGESEASKRRAAAAMAEHGEERAMARGGRVRVWGLSEVRPSPNIEEVGVTGGEWRCGEIAGAPPSRGRGQRGQS